MSLLNRHFSHIYVEEAASSLPRCERILQRYPKATVVPIDDYKEVFNRPSQSWSMQKKSMNLILARKKDDFLYSATTIAPDFGYEHFYYNALAFNCLYDCHYCYLQGMYPSANPVLFVNLEEYFEATDRKLESHTPLYLCISYDTDLMAFEHILGYCKEWIEYATSRQDLIIELRTKSANFRSIAELNPIDNVILAWTFSPAEITERYEPKTPSLTARLQSALQACEAGWKIRVCFDPVLYIDGWQQTYEEMVDLVFDTLPLEQIRDVSIGVFRMNNDYFRKTRRKRPSSDLLYQGFEKKEGITTYPEETTSIMVSAVKDRASAYIPAERVTVVDPLRS